MKTAFEAFAYGSRAPDGVRGRASTPRGAVRVARLTYWRRYQQEPTRVSRAKRCKDTEKA